MSPPLILLFSFLSSFSFSSSFSSSSSYWVCLFFFLIQCLFYLVFFYNFFFVLNITSPFRHSFICVVILIFILSFLFLLLLTCFSFLLFVIIIIIILVTFLLFPLSFLAFTFVLLLSLSPPQLQRPRIALRALRFPEVPVNRWKCDIITWLCIRDAEMCWRFKFSDYHYESNVLLFFREREKKK